jgi:intracellular sulfur oxidation DsrE/DsrF family protein
MKTIFTFLLSAFLLTSAFGQNQVTDQNTASNPAAPSKEAYKIIFQMTSSDTMVHKALMRQITNATTVAPGTQIEVVCHGPGLEMLQAEKSVVAKKLKEHVAKGVSFVACEFSMKERKVSKEQLLPEAGTVEAGIIEIVKKQSQGWFYIKSGF